MPFTLFCHLNTPKHAFTFFEENNAQIEVDAHDWTASYVFPGGFLKKKKTITFSYERDWCSPPNWPTQLAGMQNFVGSWPMEEATREKLLPLIRSFAFCVGITSEPEIKDRSDPRVEVINAIAEHMDGVLFAPDSLLDPRFRLIVSADGEVDPEAVMPALPKVQVVVGGEVIGEFEQGAGPAEDDGFENQPCDPPSAERVAKRVYAMAAVAARGLIDMNLAQGNTPAFSVQDLHAWFESLAIADELEPGEKSILYTPAGELDQQDMINSVWSLEGLVVLAWALNLYPMPQYDQLVEVDELLKALSLLDSKASQINLTQATQRPQEELAAYNNQAFAQNWRMVNYRVRPEPVDYANLTIAGRLFDLTWATLIDGDLALQGKPIYKADPELVQTINSLSVERHQASNWLRGDALLYSASETNT